MPGYKGEEVLLDVVEVSIRPVKLVIGVVNSETVGPLDLSSDDGRLVIPIHPDTSNEGFVSPVSPVHISAERWHLILKHRS